MWFLVAYGAFSILIGIINVQTVKVNHSKLPDCVFRQMNAWLKRFYDKCEIGQSSEQAAYTIFHVPPAAVLPTSFKNAGGIWGVYSPRNDVWVRMNFPYCHWIDAYRWSCLLNHAPKVPNDPRPPFCHAPTAHRWVNIGGGLLNFPFLLVVGRFYHLLVKAGQKDQVIYWAEHVFADRDQHGREDSLAGYTAASKGLLFSRSWQYL